MISFASNIKDLNKSFAKVKYGRFIVGKMLIKKSKCVFTRCNDLILRRKENYTLHPIINSFNNYSTTTISETNSIECQEALLNPKEVIYWTKEQVSFLLTTKEEKGGAGLSIETIKPLYDSGFNGNSIANIVDDLLLRGGNDNYLHAVDECWKRFPNVPRDTIKYIVNWIDRKKSKPIRYEYDELKYYLISGQVDDSNSLSLYSKLLERCMERVTLSNSFNSSKLSEKQENIKKSLGKLCNPNADWPFVYSGDKIVLDWRFSNIILPSKFENDILKENSHDCIISNLNNQFETKDYKITTLLAPSGAGKTHSLFHISNSNTAFCLPLDFGSKEDIHLRHCQKELDYLRSFTLSPNRE